MAQLFLIPTSLSTTQQLGILEYQLPLIHHLKYFIVETAKIGRQHLKLLNLASTIQQLSIMELNKHSHDLQALIQPLTANHDVGLLSDCGMPAIADPGNQIVRMAHQHQQTVIPLIGANSLMLALMASGVSGQSFTFNGYLPIDKEQLISKLHQMQTAILQHDISQIAIETPFRNQQLLISIIETLKPQLTLSIAINLQYPDQTIMSYTIAAWKQLAQLPNLHKKQVVFILGRS